MSVLGNNLLAQYYVQNQGLPDGYEAVEYLESTARQYIDSELKATNDTCIICDIMLLATSHAYNRIFGNFNNNTKSFSLNCAQGSNTVNVSRFGSFVTEQVRALQFNVNTRHTVSNSKNGLTADGVVVYQWGAAQEFTTTGNIAILASSNAAGSVPSTLNNGLYGRCYNAKWIEQGRYVRHFIPCIRKSDGKPGLYDLCRSICPLTGTPFYINAGTGEFTTP